MDEEIRKITEYFKKYYSKELNIQNEILGIENVKDLVRIIENEITNLEMTSSSGIYKETVKKYKDVYENLAQNIEYQIIKNPVLEYKYWKDLSVNLPDGCYAKSVKGALRYAIDNVTNPRLIELRRKIVDIVLSDREILKQMNQRNLVHRVLKVFTSPMINRAQKYYEKNGVRLDRGCDIANAFNKIRIENDILMTTALEVDSGSQSTDLEAKEDKTCLTEKDTATERKDKYNDFFDITTQFKRRELNVKRYVLSVNTSKKMDEAVNVFIEVLRNTNNDNFYKFPKASVNEIKKDFINLIKRIYPNLSISDEDNFFYTVVEEYRARQINKRGKEVANGGEIYLKRRRNINTNEKKKISLKYVINKCFRNKGKSVKQKINIYKTPRLIAHKRLKYDGPETLLDAPEDAFFTDNRGENTFTRKNVAILDCGRVTVALPNGNLCDFELLYIYRRGVEDKSGKDCYGNFAFISRKIFTNDMSKCFEMSQEEKELYLDMLSVNPYYRFGADFTEKKDAKDHFMVNRSKFFIPIIKSGMVRNPDRTLSHGYVYYYDRDSEKCIENIIRKSNLFKEFMRSNQKKYATIAEELMAREKNDVKTL